MEQNKGFPARERDIPHMLALVEQDLRKHLSVGHLHDTGKP
jgi:hypothetical protein